MMTKRPRGSRSFWSFFLPAGAAITVGLLGLAGAAGLAATAGGGASGGGGGAVGALLMRPGAGAGTTGLGIGAVTGLAGMTGLLDAGTAEGCAGLLTRGGTCGVGGTWAGADPDGFGSAAVSCCSEAPQYLQNAAEMSHVARQRGHDFPLAGGFAVTSGVGGGGGSSGLGVVPMASIGIGAMAGADGFDDVDEASASST
ncbi:hypothetical protein LZC95_16805 [Pendulispora brunnea]|uniref:Hydrophobin n=1 Tax=Pendulispora brunnea TaxID=2905690 RepID=A0ABZ2KIV4_9BACT